MKVMFADDDADLRAVVERVMVEDGYAFCSASDGAEALSLFDKERPDLVILDIAMPGVDGFEVCQRLRKRGVRTPVIFLSAKGDIVDKSVGFRSGCDDYLTKPFSPLELSLRVEALLRRSGAGEGGAVATLPCETLPRVSQGHMHIGELEIDFDGYEVLVDGRPAKLTSKEFEIVALLASSAGKVFTREQILEHIWGETAGMDLRSVTVFVRKIREKIEPVPSEPRYLLTVWRVGYKFATS
ncbi:MAG: response regulator transcription factor [Coriobacteriia bacterium]|nr:response regulator transcription factor [Coriobacteriia bacterium]MBS5478231.1 response regulator transcription factor [Coriobacteriia bacterium]